MSLTNPSIPTEEDYIWNYIPNRLYWHEFSSGRYFQVVAEDEYGFEVKIAEKTMFKVIYIKQKDDIDGFEIIKVVRGQATQKVQLGKFNLAQLKAFLSFISQIDLKGISEKRLKLYDEQELDATTIKTLKTLLSKDGGGDIVEALIDEGVISSKDIVNTAFRRRGLQIFKNFIDDEHYWKTYASENGISERSEEKVWQFFLEKNEWIFGYGLDYRYQSILQREAHLSDVGIDGRNTVIADYLLGDKLFTTFVEIKKPSTPLFGNRGNRSNSWTLSSDLFNSVSQILEQKASGLLKFEKQQYDKSGQKINQKPCDSKVVLIIGHWRELGNSHSDLDAEIKKRTFELFRRDSRNIEIITYDELYDRARFIVEGKKNESSSKASNSDCEDLPFEDLPF